MNAARTKELPGSFEIRELTAIEIDQVNGGLFPLLLAIIAGVVAADLGLVVGRFTFGNLFP